MADSDIKGDLMSLPVPVGQRGWCSSHTGIVVSYFHARYPDGSTTDNREELYGVLFLDEGYWANTDNPEKKCMIRHLVVHVSNLSPNKENLEEEWD